MNGRTAKVINRYSRHAELSRKEVKRQWNKLNAKQKGEVRRGMKERVGMARNTK